CYLLRSVYLPRPPLYTLFPYTTLFRSLADVHSLGEFFAWAHMHRECCSLRLIWEDVPRSHPEANGQVHEEAEEIGAALSLAVPRDRKSTRLNSSHQIISYAVFCLNKKK